MSQPIFSNTVPTPYDLLVDFQDSGNVTFVSYLFKSKEDWLSQNLSSQQEKVCESILVKLASWEDEERRHGPGAALNLSHPKMMGIFREQPWVKAKYADQIANAERLASMRRRP